MAPEEHLDSKRLKTTIKQPCSFTTSEALQLVVDELEWELQIEQDIEELRNEIDATINCGQMFPDTVSRLSVQEEKITMACATHWIIDSTSLTYSHIKK